MIDVLSMLNIGLGVITAGDWHNGRPGRILHNSHLTEGKIQLLNTTVT